MLQFKALNEVNPAGGLYLASWHPTAFAQTVDCIHADVMAERGGSQQFDTEIIGDHVGEVQAQLGVAVQRSAAAGDLAQNGVIDVAAVFVRINGDGTGTNDDVASLVGLSDGGSDGEGQQ